MTRAFYYLYIAYVNARCITIAPPFTKPTNPTN